MNESNLTAVLRRNWRLAVALLLILVSVPTLSSLSFGSPVLLRKSLGDLPLKLGIWEGTEVPIDDPVKEVLGATDLLNRVYYGPERSTAVGLFVGFFSSQKKGGAIHSPKNCLPGAGWSAIRGDTVAIAVPGRSEPMVVNRYIIQKDRQRQVVLYWYQSQGRVIASEYAAKLFLIWDALVNKRTDGALVRIVSPVVNGDEQASLEEATSFIQQAYPLLTEHIPG